MVFQSFRKSRSDYPESIIASCAELSLRNRSGMIVIMDSGLTASRCPGMTRKLMDVSPLPIDAALPDLTAALRANTAGVLVAPPGAGKTTRVPLVLAREDWAQKSAAKPQRILVLEPRRLGARPAGE